MSVEPVELVALRYHQQVHAAEQAGVFGEPEAQLTTPVAELMRAVAADYGLGELTFVRESRLDRTRPDFAVLHGKGRRVRQKGYVELKAPSIPVDASQWKGRNLSQFEAMSLEAEVLIVCNGWEARLYVNGEPMGEDATLPYDNPATWEPNSLAKLLERFLETNPRPVVSVSDLSQRLARRTADLRDRLVWLYEQKGGAGDLTREAFESWKRFVHPESSARDFADGMAQVLAYGMVLAALSSEDADADQDGFLSVNEAREAIRTVSPVMAAAFGPLVDRAPLFEAVRVEVGALETLVSAIDRKRVEKSADPRGETWLYFYEDFLSVYDPQARKEAGVYYTPIAVVQAMTRIVDHILVERFDIPLGFADSKVVTLDPAVGTGTFPLAVIEQAAKRATQRRGKDGPAQAAETLSKNLYAFELMPGPYAVTHLRLSERLKKLNKDVPLSAQVVLTDTLESPDADNQIPLPLFGDVGVLAREQDRAKRIKAEQRVTVVIGNPPYRRVSRDIEGRGSGGWVVEGKVPGRRNNKSLFDDLLDVARKHTIFSHHANLYNLYVYFWRWAIWKAFEAHGSGPGVVAFITGNSWLHGPGFIGLRKLVRAVCDEVWVLDLGGDNKGANSEENVFAIETPVSVVVLVRKEDKDKTKPAAVYYRKIDGSKAEKLADMQAVAKAENPLRGSKWSTASSDWMSSFIPIRGGQAWQGMPELSSIFPWQQPGCMYSRLWTISPLGRLLKLRWKRFVASSEAERPALYQTPRHGRNIFTKVAKLPPLADLGAEAELSEVARYGWRSFDRQYSLNDPRLAKTESPSLWAVRSKRQIYLAAMTSKRTSGGPQITCSAHVPDKDFFCGRGGRDIIPLYRDKDAQRPNITRGLLEKLGRELKIRTPSPEDLAAYVYALLSSPRYQERFADELITPGPRVPMTKDGGLWSEALLLGRKLLWLHTYAERYQDPSVKRGRHVPRVDGLGWEKSVINMPQTPRDISYDSSTQTLLVGDGRVEGVREEVWNFSVSGMQVVKKWLGYRTVRGAGRAASSKNPLDQIRPSSWPDEWNDELLDLLSILTLTVEGQATQAKLVDRICDGPLIPASALPKPKPDERKPPRVS